MLSAAAISVVSRARSGSRSRDGSPARAARISARLVTDFEPGTLTSASTGLVARGAGQGAVMATILPHRLRTVLRMCGRYVAKRDLAGLAAEFEAEDATGQALRPDYNIAPTDLVPVVVLRHRSGDRDGPRVRQLRAAKWGLVPSWAGDPGRAAKLINARAETVTELPAFRSAVRRRRCLVPADGWYEWAPRPDGAGRQPTYLTPRSGEVLAFAGLYEIWGPDRLLTSSIVTTAALGQLAAVHAPDAADAAPAGLVGLAGPGPGGRDRPARARPRTGRRDGAAPGRAGGRHGRERRPRADRAGRGVRTHSLLGR